ncbi:MAG: hypothetical protein GY906_25965 [bacterium]|nr:hypothetical protein [bacterium]
MTVQKTLSIALLFLVGAGVAGADTKIVKMSHTDAFSMMGQDTPAKDEEVITWLTENMMRVDQGDSTMIVRLDQKKMFMINHVDKTYNALDVPVDMAKLMPPGMAEGMMQMMNFTATVTPTDETKTIDGRKAQRYDINLTSQMVQMKMTSWATKDVDFKFEWARDMALEMARMQPGMDSVLEEMSKIEGFVVAQDQVVSMMGNEMNNNEKVISITDANAPAGTYDPPADYTLKEFNFAEMMQQ